VQDFFFSMSLQSHDESGAAGSGERGASGLPEKSIKKKIYTYEAALALTWKRPIILFLFCVAF
jgi:hypothetical protein